LQRSFLIFALAFVALMVGALFYAAKLPLTERAKSPDEPPASALAESAAQATAPVIVSFTLADTDGVQRDFGEWAGKHRLLNFWATWCAPCRREIPLLKEFQAEQAGDRLQVIGIAVDFPEPVIAYAEQAEFNYPILVGEMDAMAVAESSGVDFIGLPFTMVVADDGELVGTHMGEIHQQHLDDIASILARFDRGEVDKATVRRTINSL
jgi:thiol-disulfide isomerase/thioredoxin